MSPKIIGIAFSAFLIALSFSAMRSSSIRSEAIRLALRDLGYIEGQKTATEYRYAEGKLDRAPGRGG